MLEQQTTEQRERVEELEAALARVEENLSRKEQEVRGRGRGEGERGWIEERREEGEKEGGRDRRRCGEEGV